MPFTLAKFVRALFKGVGHRYIKRIPYMTPKGQRYRYIYKVEHTHQGRHAFDEAHLVEGTKFALSTESGAEFHGHITAVDGDKVTYTIDDGPRKGEVVDTTKAELAAKLNEVHGYKDKLYAERAKVSEQLQQMKAGDATEKQIARVRRRLLALGGEEKRVFPLFREEPKSRRLNARIRELEREVLAANRAVDKQPHYISLDDLPKSEEEERLRGELHEIYSEFTENESTTKPLSRAALQRVNEIQDALLPAKKRAERASQVARDKKDRLSIEASRIREKAEREHYDLTTYHDLALPSEREPDEKPYEYMRREGERLIKLAEAREDVETQRIRDRAYLGESKVPRNPAVTRYNEERRNKELAEGRRLLRVADSKDPQAQERKRIEDILHGLEYTAEGESDVTRAGKRTASSRKRDGVLQDYIRGHVRTLEPSRERADLEAAAQAYKDAEHDKTRERRDAARDEIRRILSREA